MSARLLVDGGAPTILVSAACFFLTILFGTLKCTEKAPSQMDGAPWCYQRDGLDGMDLQAGSDIELLTVLIISTCPSEIVNSSPPPVLLR